jgi:hypothetical protein
MHKHDWSRIGSVTVRVYSGEITKHNSLDDAVIYVGERHVAAMKYGFMRRWCGLWAGEDAWSFDGDHYEFRDEYDLRIPLWKIKEVAGQIDWYPWRRRRRKNFDFRRGPVEGISCYRGGYRYFRRIRTGPEISANLFLHSDDEAREYEIKARGARRKGNLPTTWDDIGRSGYSRSKCWKRHRRTQWK